MGEGHRARRKIDTVNALWRYEDTLSLLFCDPNVWNPACKSEESTGS
jgi:hypothetical protein